MKHEENAEVSNKKVKKKHHLLWLWITLGVVFTLVIAPVGLAYALFFDSYTKELNINENMDIKDLTNNLLVDSLDETKTQHKIDFKIAENDLNQLLYAASKSFVETSGGMLEQFYVTINEDNYTFSLKAKVPMFQTKVDIVTILEDVEDSTNHANDYFSFSIKDLRVGRVGGMGGIMTSILSKYINDDSIESMLSGAGLHIDADLEHGKLTYKHIQLLDDLQAIIGDSESMGIYYDVMADFMKSGLVDFSFYNNKTFAGAVDLTPTNTNATYCTSEKMLDIPLDDYRNKTATLVNSNIIDAEHTADVYSYLLRGYLESDTTIQQYVNGKDFSSVGISDVTTYTGYPLSHVDDIDAKLKNQMTPAGIASGKIGKIYEDDINDVIKSTHVIGYTYLLQRLVDNAYKINYLSVDNFYINIVDDHMYLVIGLNANGYETSVILVADEQQTSNYALNFKVDNSFYGTLTCGDELENLFFDLIATATDNEDWIVVNPTAKTMQISFASAINSSSYKTAIDTYGDVVINCLGGDLAADGYLDVTITPHA
jgi:hypothetical protein